MVIMNIAVLPRSNAIVEVFKVYRAVLTPIRLSKVRGEVSIFVASSGLIGIGSATGLERSLTSSDCVGDSACGVHVSSGTVCHQTGEPFFSGSWNPWRTVGYNGTSAGGEANFDFNTINEARDIEGRAFVIRNAAGSLVSCGILYEMQYNVSFARLSPLNNSGVEGFVTLYTTDTMVIGAGRAELLERNLRSPSMGGSDCVAVNGCGVHVHAGFSCDNMTSQGGHHFVGDLDPWEFIRYPSTSATGNTTFVFSIVGETDVLGRAFIVHRNDGGRVTCGLLQDHSIYKVFHAPLRELDNSGVNGDVAIFVRKNGLLGVGYAYGLEPNLGNANYGLGFNCTATNGCGAHVHAGDSCEPDRQGGHFFSGAVDPWRVIGYPSSSGTGNATFDFIIEDPATDIAGRPFIVHRNDGGRVSCGILRQLQYGVWYTALSPLGREVTGTVTMLTVPNIAVGAGAVFGLPASLNQTNCTGSTACAVAVHEGFSCASNDQGEALFEGMTNPWDGVGYEMTDAQGRASFVFNISDPSATNVIGRAFIATSNFGSRETCGLLRAMSAAERVSSARVAFAAFVLFLLVQGA